VFEDLEVSTMRIINARGFLHRKGR